jgi:DnaK suppressor protein
LESYTIARHQRLSTASQNGYKLRRNDFNFELNVANTQRGSSGLAHQASETAAGDKAVKAMATDHTKPQAAAGKKPAPKKAAPKKAASKPKPAAKPAAKKAAAKPAAKHSAKKAASKPVKPAAKAAGKSAAKPAAKKAAAKSVAKKASAKPASKAKTVAKKATLSKAKPAAKATKPAAVPKSKVATKKVAARADSTPAKGKKADVKTMPSTVVQPVKPPPAPPSKTASGKPLAPSGVSSSAMGAGTVKASYQMIATQPLLTPPPPVAIKKDPKLANNWKTKSAQELSDAEVMAMPDSEYMNDKQMAFFRLKLVQLKQGILDSADETTEHLREDTVVVPDPADRATIEEEHALELRTRDRERKLLKKIEQSIVRIDAGDYGYCDETGEPIGVGRLIARPTATLSLEAQQRRELKQKMYGD